jgi:hypothetical protein
VAVTRAVTSVARRGRLQCLVIVPRDGHVLGWTPGSSAGPALMRQAGVSVWVVISGCVLPALQRFLVSSYHVAEFGLLCPGVVVGEHCARYTCAECSFAYKFVCPRCDRPCCSCQGNACKRVVTSSLLYAFFS